MKNAEPEKELYERPRMEIILLETGNVVLTSCPEYTHCPFDDGHKPPCAFFIDPNPVCDPDCGHDTGSGCSPTDGSSGGCGSGDCLTDAAPGTP